MLSGDLESNEKWKDPWDSPTLWLTFDMNVGHRLNSLYKKLVCYSCLTLYGEAAATKMGIRPSQQAHFKSISLDPAKVYQSIALLARWRQCRMTEYICAFQIAVIWS
jgi:hypothetical protein